MTTPTTAVTFSSIQTEFGGANPIALSEYVKGGTYVPSGQTTSATDGTAIPTTASGLRVGMFRGLTKTVATNVASNFGTPVYNTSTATGVKTAQFKLNSNGTTTYTHSFSGQAIQTSAGFWYSPTTTGIGSSYWARATISTPVTGGTLNGTYNTWIQLTSGTNWWVNSGSSNAEVTAAIDIDIAASAGGAVLGSGYVSFDAGYTP